MQAHDGVGGFRQKAQPEQARARMGRACGETAPEPFTWQELEGDPKAGKEANQRLHSDF